jgi:CDP-diacylglycerol pyrophosphatase
MTAGILKRGGITRSLATSAAAAAAITIAIPAAPAPTGHPNALWRVVHGLCLRDKRLSGLPVPCLAVDRVKGVAVVPDLSSPTQVLLVPTIRIEGIESPALQAPGSVNYWQAAWDARRWFETRLGRATSRDRIAMAVNSASSRSQDQLHIHIDCVRSEVRKALIQNQTEIGYAWAPLSFLLIGQRFQARRLDGADLGARDPFRLLAAGDSFARGHMARETLVVIGAVFADGSPGFFLLSDHAGSRGRNPAFGEVLLDHKCAVLSKPDR